MKGCDHRFLAIEFDLLWKTIIRFVGWCGQFFLCHRLKIIALRPFSRHKCEWRHIVTHWGFFDFLTERQNLKSARGLEIRVLYEIYLATLNIMQDWTNLSTVLKLQSSRWEWNTRVWSLLVSLILGYFNVCFDFPLIRVAIALNIREAEHWQREGVKGAPSVSIDTIFVTEGTTDVK